MESDVSSVDSRLEEYREDIHALVHAHLDHINLSQEVEQLMEEIDSEAEINDDVIFQKLTERGLIAPVLESVDKLVKEKQEKLDHPLLPDPPALMRRQRAKEGVRGLSVTLIRGRAFLEHLQSEEMLPGTPAPTFFIHAYFQDQRLMSPELPCHCDPEIAHTFQFSLSVRVSRDLRGPDLLGVSEGVSLVLVRRELDGRRNLFGTGVLEWRRVLVERGLRVEGSVEVLGVGSESAVPTGVLEYRMELELGEGEMVWLRENPVTFQLLNTQQGLEQSRRTEQQRLFLIYSKQWWSQYSQLRPVHRVRKVPLFPPSESGTPLLACCYVSPLNTHRLIESPRAALRFCSLIPRCSDPLTPGHSVPSETWLSRGTALSCRGVGQADRTVLLCSLLLGFGLNSFVCAGTDRSGACYWVATLEESGPTLLWDAGSGQRYTHQRQTVSDALEGRVHPREYPYITIGSLFNHKHFFANVQETDSVPLCSFEVGNPSIWKSLDPEAIRAVTLPPWPPASAPLLPPSTPGIEASERLERELKALLLRFRLERELTTHWDEQLSYILAPSLVAYEAEREMGCVLANEDFQQAVRCHVKSGHTFKGYPVQFNSCEADKVFRHCLKSDLCQEIVTCRGDSLQFAVRVRVTCYPDEVFAVWVMWACHYTSVL